MKLIYFASGHRLPIKSHNSLNSTKMFSNYAKKNNIKLGGVVCDGSDFWFYISHTALLLYAIHNASYKAKRKEVRERAALKLQLLSI